MLRARRILLPLLRGEGRVKGNGCPELEGVVEEAVVAAARLFRGQTRSLRQRPNRDWKATVRPRASVLGVSSIFIRCCAIFCRPGRGTVFRPWRATSARVRHCLSHRVKFCRFAARRKTFPGGKAAAGNGLLRRGRGTGAVGTRFASRCADHRWLLRPTSEDGGRVGSSS